MAAIATTSIVAAAFADKTTVKLEAPAPKAVVAGTIWEPELQLSRRGRRLDGFRPVLEIEDAFGHRRYIGTETRPGVYRVRVIFPRLGPWSYEIRVGHETMRGGLIRVVPQ